MVGVVVISQFYNLPLLKPLGMRSSGFNNLWRDNDGTITAFNMLIEVILMLVFGWVKLLERLKHRYDVIPPVAFGALQRGHKVGFLGLVGIGQCRPILSTLVGLLPIKGRWVMNQKKEVKDDLFWDDRLVKSNLDCLGVASLTRGNLAIGGFVDKTARIARNNFSDALQSPVDSV